jgi:hypothetical protein
MASFKSFTLVGDNAGRSERGVGSITWFANSSEVNKCSAHFKDHLTGSFELALISFAKNLSFILKRNQLIKKIL